MLEHSRLKHILAWILLAVVFLVCVAPGVDLDDCSPCMDHAASLLVWLIAAFLALVIPIGGANEWSPLRSAVAVATFRSSLREPHLLDLLSVRRI